MRYSFAPLALAALAAANPMPQGVTSSIAPSATAPAGCSGDYPGTFEISVVNVTSSSKTKRQAVNADDTLVMTLSGGILKDSEGRTGYIASNNQFQFDNPPQAGAIYTAGWSVCGNGSLTIGADSVFYKCLSGTFYNLYDTNDAGQCSPIYIDTIAGGSSSAASQSTAAASQLSDGQVTATPVSTSAVCEYTDGQPQVTGCPVSQISDGQIQATTGTAAPVSQISDGQIQATTAAPTSSAVCEYVDGQPQAGCTSATTAAPVSQISDGQIQASTGSNTTFASPSATVQAYTGAAMPTAIRGELFGIAAGVLAIAML